MSREIPALPCAGEGSPFIPFTVSAGVLRTEVLVGAGAVGAGKKRGAVNASLLWYPRSLTPYFNLACEFSFLAGGRRSFDLIRSFLPQHPCSEEFTGSFFVNHGPTSSSSA